MTSHKRSYSLEVDENRIQAPKVCELCGAARINGYSEQHPARESADLLSYLADLNDRDFLAVQIIWIKIRNYHITNAELSTELAKKFGAHIYGITRDTIRRKINSIIKDYPELKKYLKPDKRSAISQKARRVNEKSARPPLGRFSQGPGINDG